MDGSSVFYETYSVLLELNRIIKALKFHAHISLSGVKYSMIKD